MMMTIRARRTLMLVIAGLLVSTSGCAVRSGSAGANPMDRVVPTATLTAGQAITVDGKLDEPIWAQAPSVSLQLPQTSDQPQPIEGGQIKIVRGSDFLYVGVTLTDRDVLQEDDQDQQHHYRTGDVIEVFLMPDTPPGAAPGTSPAPGAAPALGTTHYWELYVTPQGRHTAFFYPSRGHLTLPSTLTPLEGLKTAAAVQGTLNHWQDEDQGWTAEMAIPLQALAQRGVPLTPDVPWRILIARYNYGRQLPRIELSAYPRMPKPAWHELEVWGPLH